MILKRQNFPIGRAEDEKEERATIPIFLADVTKHSAKWFKEMNNCIPTRTHVGL